MPSSTRCAHGLLRDTRALLCEAVQRRLCVPGQLQAELDERDTHGTAHARRSLDDIAAGCRSATECEVRDACWPEAWLVVEVDSRSWHGFGDAPERTERRRALLAELGWRVLPIAPARIRREPEAALMEIEAAYVAGVRD